MNELQLKVMNTLWASPYPVPEKAILDTFGEEAPEAGEALNGLVKQEYAKKSGGLGQAVYSALIGPTDCGLQQMHRYVLTFYDGNRLAFLRDYIKRLSSAERQLLKALLS